MFFLQRRSIKDKLRLVVLLTATLGITFAAVAFLSYDQIKQRETLTKEMQILSKVVAIRSAVALSFIDKVNTLSNLRTLHIRDNFRLGCIYDQSKTLFVKSSTNPKFGACATQINNLNHNLIMTRDYLDTYQPIMQNNKAIGLVFVRVGLDELYDRFQQQIIVSLAILLGSLSLAFLFTARLQKQIYNPIIHLGEVAAQVTDKQNYSIRAKKETDDELGDTVDAFNDMLSEIESDKKHMFKLAHYDHLTQLPNRRMFAERIDVAINGTHKNPDELLAVMLLDLDKFKDVNDTLGHDIGDTLLKEFAERIRTVLPSKASIFRLGGDEFIVIQKNMQTQQDIIDTANLLLAAFKSELIVAGHTLNISLSIGIAISDGSDSSTTILKNADIAMYQVKESGRGNYKIFNFPIQEKLKHNG